MAITPAAQYGRGSTGPSSRSGRAFGRSNRHHVGAVRIFFTIIKGAPSRAGRSGLGRALQGAHDHLRECVTGAGTASLAAGVVGSLAAVGAAAWPAASCAVAHRRGPLPLRRYPASAARRFSPLRTLGGSRGQELSGRPPRAGHHVAAEDHRQGPTSSLRCGRTTLTVIFHGKTRHLSGGRRRIGDCQARGPARRTDVCRAAR